MWSLYALRLHAWAQNAGFPMMRAGPGRSPLQSLDAHEDHRSFETMTMSVPSIFSVESLAASDGSATQDDGGDHHFPLRLGLVKVHLSPWLGADHAARAAMIPAVT